MGAGHCPWDGYPDGNVCNTKNGAYNGRHIYWYLSANSTLVCNRLTDGFVGNTYCHMPPTIGIGLQDTGLVNPPHWQWLVPMGNWRVLNFPLVPWNLCLLSYVGYVWAWTICSSFCQHKVLGICLGIHGADLPCLKNQHMVTKGYPTLCILD